MFSKWTLSLILLHLEGMYVTLPIKTKGRYSKDQSADKNSVSFSISNKNLENMKVSLGTRKKNHCKHVFTGMTS